MKVVAPLRIDSVAPIFARRHDPWVVQIALCDQHQPALKRSRQLFDLCRKLFQEMHRRPIDKLMHRIQPKTVDVVVPHPHQSVVAEKSPHMVASSIFEVHCIAPRRAMLPCHVRPKHAAVVPHWTEVVIDHIQQHGQTLRMTRINQSLQPIRPAIHIRHRKQRGPVIAPAIPPWKRRHRHQLNVSHTKLKEIIESPNRRIERTFRSKRPHMQLIDHSAV